MKLKQNLYFGVEGNTYKSIYSSFILFIPFMITNIFIKPKDKKEKIAINSLTIVELALTIIYLILFYKKIISSYYYSKNNTIMSFIRMAKFSIYDK